MYVHLQVAKLWNIELREQFWCTPSAFYFRIQPELNIFSVASGKVMKNKKSIVLREVKGERCFCPASTVAAIANILNI